MADIQAVSGPYTWYYNFVALGVVEDAPTLRFESSAEPVTGDNLGDAIQTVINRGGNAYLDMVFQEWSNAAAQAAFWPYAEAVPQAGVAAAGILETGTVDLSSSYAASLGCPMKPQWLIGERVANSCAEPERLYAKRAILAPNFNISYMMGSRLRNVPVSFLLMPWLDKDPGSGTSPTQTVTNNAITHVHNTSKMCFWVGGDIPGP